MGIEIPERVAKNTDHFTGRTWLVQKLLTWWDDCGDERIFLLTGDPGTGKSMIVAWLAGYGPMPKNPTKQAQLARVRALVKAAHFCVADSGNTDPKEVARQIADHLTRTVPGFGKALAATLADQVRIDSVLKDVTVQQGGSATGVYIGHLNLQGLSEELSFNRVLRDPLQQLYKDGYDHPMLLLFDALDEALTYSGRTNVVQLLAKFSDLPPGVRILATTRKEPEVLKFFHGIKPFDLIKDKDAPPDVDDVRTYATDRLKQLTTVAQRKRDEFAERLALQAQGVFLYAAMVLDELLNRPPSELPDLGAYPLPKGLSGIYHEFLIRVLGKDLQRWFELYEPMLGLIAVAQGEGLTATQLTAILGKNIRAALVASKQYLSGELPDGPFRPFHKSFADFLLEDDGNIDYQIDATNMHQRIVSYYRAKADSWATRDWTKVDNYGLMYLSHHLYELKETEEGRAELYDLICKPLMQEKWLRYGSNLSFIKDLNLASNVAAEDWTTKGWVRLVRTCLVYVTFRTQMRQVPPEVLCALARVGEIHKAFDYAAVIEDETHKVDVYLDIGQTLLDHNITEEAKQSINMALSVARRIEDSQEQAKALRKAEQALKEVGDLQRLAQLVGVSNTKSSPGDGADHDSRVKTLSYVSQRLVQNEDSIRTRIETDRAWAEAKGIQDDKAQANAFYEVAKALVKLGDLEQALTVADVIPHYIQRCEALKQVVKVLGQEGGPDPARLKALANRALAVAERLQNEQEKAHAFSQVAQAMVHVGALAWARTVTGWAMTEAEGISKLQDKVYVLGDIALALAQIGDRRRANDMTRQARAIAGKIEEDQERIETLCQVKYVVARINRFRQSKSRTDDARTVAKGIHDGSRHANAICEISTPEEFTRALTIALEMEDDQSKVEALCRVVEAMAKIGNFSRAAVVAHQALEVAEGIEEDVDGPHSEALSRVVGALAQARDFTKALTVIKSIGFPEFCGEAVCKVAVVLGEVGATDWLKQTLAMAEKIRDDREIMHDRERTDAIRTVLEAMARAGQQAQALEVVRNSFLTARFDDRARLFDVMNFSASRLAAIDGGQTLWRICESIKETDEWWCAP